MKARSNHRMVAFIVAGVVMAFTIMLLITLGYSRLVVIVLAGYSIALSALILLFFRRAR
jgi:hypothetical protein